MPMNGKKSAQGQHKVIPVSDWRKQAYLDWLCTPRAEREPPTQVGMAEQLGFDRRTLQNWQKDADFLREWERRYLQTIGDPSRKSQIMDTLFQAACDIENPKHVSAAKEYFVIEGSLSPRKMDVRISKDPDELTDEAIENLIAAHARSERERRAADSG